MLHPPSDEQANIIKSVSTHNVLVDAVAGSGKTTTNLHIAKAYPDKNIILLTYNSKLRLETCQKAESLGITNLTTHTYHSFCRHKYDVNCSTDAGLLQIVRENIASKQLTPCDLLVLDEAQDIRPLLYRVICKVYSDICNVEKDTPITTHPTLCILGDVHQSIYDYARADPRFITEAAQCFNFNDLPWKTLPLSFSWRVTKPMAEFINTSMLRMDRIHSIKTGIKPRYLICNVYSGVANLAYKAIASALRTYKPEDVFVLAPSVKSTANTPLKRLENLIKEKLRIPVFVPSSDEEKINTDVLGGKLVFSTFHQAKGMERKVVVIYGFDSSYFKFFKKDKSPDVCCNELYVATTRASERLIMVQQHNTKPLPFLDIDNLKRCCVIESMQKGKEIIPATRTRIFAVTELTKHMAYEDLEHCMKYITLNHMEKPKNNIHIPGILEQDTTAESVSDITGGTIPLWFEYMRTRRLGINITAKDAAKLEKLATIAEPAGGFDDDVVDDTIPKQYSLKDIKKKAKNKTLEIDDMLYYVNLWNAIKSGFINKFMQIQSYNWISNDNLTQCMERMKELNISRSAQYEKKVIYNAKINNIDSTVIGFIDCVDSYDDSDDINDRDYNPDDDSDDDMNDRDYNPDDDSDDANADAVIANGVDNGVIANDAANTMYEFKCTDTLCEEHFIQLAVYAFMSRKFAHEMMDDDREYKHILYNILSGEKVEIIIDDTFQELMTWLIARKYTSTPPTPEEKFHQFVRLARKKYGV